MPVFLKRGTGFLLFEGLEKDLNHHNVDLDFLIYHPVYCRVRKLGLGHEKAVQVFLAYVGYFKT